MIVLLFSGSLRHLFGQAAEDARAGIIHLALRHKFRTLIHRGDAQRFIRRHLRLRAAATVLLAFQLAHGVAGRRMGIRLLLLRRFSLRRRFILLFSGVRLAALRSAAAHSALVVAHIRRQLDGIDRLLHALPPIRR